MEPVDRYCRMRSGKKGVICYYRCREGNRRKETCSNNRSIRSDKAHPAVWDLISDLLSDPERLRTGLEAMIEEQRQALRGNPEHEIKVWLEKLAALDRKRSGYLDLAAEGILEREELRAKLAELQEARETVEKELRVIEGWKDHVQQLEHDRDALMEHYAGLVPESLNDLSPEERHQSTRCSASRYWRTRISLSRLAGASSMEERLARWRLTERRPVEDWVHPD